jgi:predicted permease
MRDATEMSQKMTAFRIRVHPCVSVVSVLQEWVQAIRQAVYRLANRPWSTAMMVLMLAIGIGTSTAVFSFMSEVLLHPMGLSHPERVMKLVRVEDFLVNGVKIASGQAGPDAEEVRIQREDNTAFQGVAQVRAKTCVMRVEGQNACQVKTAFVTADYFQVLAVQPRLGRVFSEAEQQAGEPVAILGHGLWKAVFDGERNILGSGLLLNGKSFRIVGVAPRGFAGHRSGEHMEIWCPMAAEPPGAERFSTISGIARLKPGVTLKQAQAALRVVASRYTPLSKEPFKVLGPLELGPLDLDRGKLLGERLPSAWLLLSVSGLLLMLACVNAGNLRLAEQEARRQEFATRLAMGAGRRDLVRQLLGENLLLAVLSGLLGLGLARPMMMALSHVGDVNVYERALEPVLSGEALLMALILVLVSAMLVGLPSAIQASRANLSDVLKEGSSRITRGTRFQDVLVMFQVALALGMVVCGFMVSRGLERARKMDLGFRPDHIAAMRLEFPPSGKEPARRMQLIRGLQDRAVALPGVRGACMAGEIPMEEGNTTATSIGKSIARLLYVGPGYFRLMGIPLLAGRDLETSDLEGRAELVSATYAQRAWPGEDPIGKSGKVIGVVADHAVSQDSSLHEPLLFWPMGDVFPSTLCLLVRTQDRPENLFPALRQIARETDPDMPIVRLTTLEEHLGSLHHHLRVAAQLLGFCGIVSLILAVMGVQSLMAFRVSRQAREISLRMALGAQRRGILMQVLWSGLSRVLAGLALGSLGAFALGNVFHRLLKGVEPLDWRSLMGSVLLIAIASLLACLFPALHAASMDPAQALREE